MKNRRKKREAFGEHSYWQSYSDMMAALLLVFVLIIAITLAIYRQKTVDLDRPGWILTQPRQSWTRRLWSWRISGQRSSFPTRN